jgi:peroxiredoxin
MNLTDLPDNLPAPVDDGAADHLLSTQLPDIELPATDGETMAIAQLPGLVVYYIYPMTGRPDTPLPDNWDGIPGARGCTPQSCGFRDHHAELTTLNARVFGVSVQTTEYQQEAKARLHLPFELLSDKQLKLKQTLQLPTFEVEGMELYKRITLIAQNGNIVKVYYPVFPPGENADDVMAWLQSNSV